MSSPGYFGKEARVGVHCHVMSFRNRSRGGLTGAEDWQPDRLNAGHVSVKVRCGRLKQHAGLE